MESETKKEITRTRVSFKQSTKDKITADITFEAENMNRNDVMVEATKLLDEAMVIARERSSL